MTFQRNHGRKGFTLVELLIVVIILGILAAVVVPQFTASTDDAKAAALDATLSRMRSAVDLYYQQHGEYPSAKLAGGTFGAADSADAFINQLSRYTDADGEASNTFDDSGCPASPCFIYGPYLRKQEMPPEPYSGSAAVEVATAGTLGMAATAPAPGPGGWKFDNKTGQLIVNHDDRDHL